METTEQVESSEKLFAVLCKVFAKHPKLSARITADLRARTKHATLPNYHNNGASESEKLELYKLYQNALLKGDFSQLLGQVAQGQAQGEAEPVKQIEDKPAPKVTPQVPPLRGMTPLGMTEQPKSEPVEEKVVQFPPQPAPASPFDALIEQRIVEILARTIKPSAPPEPAPTINELMCSNQLRQAVRGMVNDEVRGVIKTEVERIMQQQQNDYLEPFEIRQLIAASRTEIFQQIKTACDNTRKDMFKIVMDALKEGSR